MVCINGRVVRVICSYEVGVYDSAGGAISYHAVDCKCLGCVFLLLRRFWMMSEVSSVVWGRFTRASLLSAILRFTEVFGYFDFSCLTVRMCIILGLVRLWRPLMSRLIRVFVMQAIRAARVWGGGLVDDRPHV